MDQRKVWCKVHGSETGNLTSSWRNRLKFSARPEKEKIARFSGLYNTTCECCGGLVTLAAPDKKNTFKASIFNKAIRHLHKSGKYEPEMLNDEPFLSVVTETNRILANGLELGIADNMPPPAMVNALRNDVFIFSGLKTHATLKESSELLLSHDGKIKSYAQFKADVLSIHQAYNVQYLESEYIFATSSAEMAAKWADLEKGSDRYNLQYRTAGDDRVREWHAALADTTLPDTDPFWNKYYPPNGWRCRCTVVQVRIGKYPESDPEAALRNGEKATTRLDKNGNNADEIFRFNPGKQKVIFPPKHPYKQVQEKVKGIVESLSENAQVWDKIETDKGSIRIHKLHNISERSDNITTASYMANSHGYAIDLLPVYSDQKNADSFNRTLKINQEYKTNKVASKSAIDNELRDASKQADHIVIRITSGIDDLTLSRGIKGRVKRENNIKSVTIIWDGNDKTYERSYIMKKGFKL